VKHWERIVGTRPPAGRGAEVDPDSETDTRSGFDDLRRKFGSSLVREPGSPLLLRTSFELLLDAFLTRAQQRRTAVGLAAFELEDWKSHYERAGAQGFAASFIALATELRRRVRLSDDLGRLGEGSIVVVLPGCEPQALGSVAERLRLTLESRELPIGPAPVRPSISVVSLPAAPRTGTTTATRLLEELESLVERGAPQTLG
jgi:GGDEF domain-containing protein